MKKISIKNIFSCLLFLLVFSSVIFIMHYDNNHFPLKIKQSDISMEPTIPIGSSISIERAGHLFRGDVIAYKRNNRVVIARIAGMPGETITILDIGVAVNHDLVYGFNDLVNESSARHEGKMINGNFRGIYTWNLAGDEYLLIVDNSTIPAAGRVCGPIKLDEILGRWRR